VSGRCGSCARRSACRRRATTRGGHGRTAHARSPIAAIRARLDELRERRGRILIVDDNPFIVKLLVEWLEHEHFAVSTAADGLEALAKIEAEKPDLVLLNVMMPGMDGYEVCRRIKADPAAAHIPVILVAGFTDDASRVRGFEAGADDFITKPFHLIALTARVRELLR
jgi:DNA-binding response OmpR family regulator